MSGPASLLSSTELCSLGVSSDLVSSNPLGSLTSPRLVKDQEGGEEEERKVR